MRALILSVLLGATLGLCACGGGSDQDAVIAVTTFLRQQQPSKTEMPPAGALIPGAGDECVITGPNATPGTAIRARCEWSVEENGQIKVVKVTETWKCADFNTLAGNPGFCQGEEGSHTWNYELDQDGKIRLLIENGSAPAENLFSGAPKS